jgi:hypothetical protein
MIYYCSKTSPCGQIRNCDYCCARRQARIADHASQIALIHHQIYLSVIKPLNPTAEEIKKARANIVRHHEARAGIWTVETGDIVGQLHLNIMTPFTTGYTPPGCVLWEDGQPCNPRNVAAYISKRKSMPHHKHYSGNMFGHWNHISHRLTSFEASPIVQAAALNDIIKNHHQGKTPDVAVQSGTFDRELARQNLRHLHAMLTKER